MPIAQGMDPKTHKSGRRLVRAAMFGVATVAILAVGLTQLLLDDGEAAGCTGSCKRPPFAAGWSYQLQGTPRVIRSARVYDVDGLDTLKSYVKRVHKLGGYAICYISAGTWEDWRRDKGALPELRARQQQRLARRALARHPQAHHPHPDHAPPHRQVRKEGVRRSRARQRRRLLERHRLPADSRATSCATTSGSPCWRTTMAWRWD